MSNERLRTSVMGQAEPVLRADEAAHAWTLAPGIGQAPDLRDVFAASTL